MSSAFIARAACAWVAGLALAQAAAAADPAEVRSPNGVLQVQLRVDNDGRPEYSIARNGKPLVNWSRLGFILVDAPKLERNFSIVNVAKRGFDDTWEQPWGERRYVRDHGSEMRVSLRQKYGQQLDVVFRVFDDGVGFRYEFPGQPQLKQVNIVDELTEFDIAEPATACGFRPASGTGTNTCTSGRRSRKFRRRIRRSR